MIRRSFFLSFVLLMVTMVIGCAKLTGRSAGRNIDDATITTEVKGKLAGDSARTLTSVHVNTVNGTVYLSGMVPDAYTRQRATEIARSIDGVEKVVNNIQTSAGDVPSSSYKRPADEAPRRDY
jgi:hyperosmotically inducible periplasmic protein